MSRSGFVSDNGPGRLFALVGLPHAGKSTFANRWVREASTDPAGTWRPRVVLAGDDFRLALHGQEYVAQAEHFVFSTLDVAAAALLLRGFDVLIDETSTSKPTLMRYLRLDPKVELIFVRTPTLECKRRATANGKAFLHRVIDRLEPRLRDLEANWPQLRAELLSQVEHLVPLCRG